MSPIILSPLDLVLAALLVLASAGLSLVLSLGIHRALVWSAVRMIVQLLLVGLLLRVVFQQSSPWLTAGLVVAMIVAATYEVGSRQERRLQGWWRYGIGGMAVGTATLVIAILALTTALRPDPWWDARHAIPLTGIVLGTAMNAASLALNAIFAGAVQQRAAIEARLALGADRHLAFRDLIRRAIRTGLIPTINQMAGAGIITLPGIMTGQVLAGMDPVAAATYQILLMFLLASAGFAGAALASRLAVVRLTDRRDRLRLDRLGSG